MNDSNAENQTAKSEPVAAPRGPSRFLIWLPLLALIPVVLAVAAFFLMRDTYQPYGTRLINVRPLEANQFTLQNPQGKPVSLSDFSGKVTLIFFGFVNCPDVCPTTMLELRKVHQALSPVERERVQVVLISVDPDRDTKEELGKYVSFFDPTFVGLTGTNDQVAEVAKKYGVFYQKSQIKSSTEYNVDHTATVFALDGKGQLRLIYGNGRAAETDRVVRDVRWLLRG
ncbi:MAG: SCO family protein [Meiothermus sp.]|nr:SCO family protein [Meiothermus sp.]